MILVFGGTTEGRKTVEVLEQAGSPYYYSTRSSGQAVELLHGIRLEGELDVTEMTALCREHDIRLIVDAAHPFAEALHTNLLYTAGHIGAPVIRYDRIYPARDSAFTWCRDYNEAISRMEAKGISRLLALTGVNTIGKLRPYWEKHPDCWFRILNRRASQLLARKSSFPEDHLIYDEDDDTAALLQRLQPQAIVTKESGTSGGFIEKVEAARQAGVRVFVIMRPDYPPHIPVPQPVRIEHVNGPYGLRRMVEQLLPDFFSLKSGLTTGTCATAAAIAATLQLHLSPLTSHLSPLTSPLSPLTSPLSPLTSPLSPLPSHVPVILPDGETISVPVGYGPGYAYCIKQAGDDPDVTDGLEIRATCEVVEEKETAENEEQATRNEEQATRNEERATRNEEQATRNELPIEIRGGQGVGRFTLPGFDYPPGEAAINRVPRQMIQQNLRALLPLSFSSLSLSITISVPDGEEIAKKTFNPRLGIEGGISIIGVSGIVKPFSEEAFIQSIRKCMEVAKAAFTEKDESCEPAGQQEERVVINSGAKSERFVRARYPDLPRQAFVEYGNYIGQTLAMAHELAIPNITLGVMLGKAVKLAAGHLDTHSRRSTMDRAFISQMLREAGCAAVDISSITLARELWDLLSAAQKQAFARVVKAHCLRHCQPLVEKESLTILLIDDEGNIY